MNTIGYVEKSTKTTAMSLFYSTNNPSDITALRHLLVYAAKGISMYAHRTRELAVTDSQIDQFTTEAVVIGMTANSSFNLEQIWKWIIRADVIRERAQTLYEWTCAPLHHTPEKLAGPTRWRLPSTIQEAIAQGQRHQTGDTLVTHTVNTEATISKCMEKARQTCVAAAYVCSIGYSPEPYYAYFHQLLSEISTSTTPKQIRTLYHQIQHVEFDVPPLFQTQFEQSLQPTA